MPLPKYVQEAFDSKNNGVPGSVFNVEGEPQESGLPNYVVDEMEKRKEPEEWGPEWMREHPNLAGLYGAGKGILEQAIVPSIETVGMIGGSIGSPIVGTALGYGIARQLSDFLVDSYKKMGGEKTEYHTVSDEMLQSAADVGSALVLGKAMDTGAKVAPLIEDYLFKSLPKRLYGSAIKTPMSKKWIQTLPDEVISKQTAVIKEGLDSKIMPSEHGLSKIKNLEKEVSKYIDDITKALSTDSSKTISREAVLEKGLKKAYEKATNSSDPIGAKVVVDNIAKKFRAHPNSLNPEKANQIKRQLYKEIKFGSAEPSAIRSQLDAVGKKGVAREIMLNLEEVYPALKGLNETSAARIGLTEAIEKAYAKEAQKNIIPIGAKILMRPKTWPLSIWESTMGHPLVKTRLAFTLHKANPARYPAKPPGYAPKIEPAEPVKPVKPVKPPEPLVGLRETIVPEKPYTPGQLNKMLRSKNVIKVDTALESIIDKRTAAHLAEREQVTTINKMLNSLKNEGSSTSFGTGKKKLIEPASKSAAINPKTWKPVAKSIVKPKIQNPTVEPETLYHYSDLEFKGGKPPFDAWYGDKSFANSYDDMYKNRSKGAPKVFKYAIKLPRDARVLDISKGSADSRKFMNDVVDSINPNSKEWKEVFKAYNMSYNDFKKGIKNGSTKDAINDFEPFWQDITNVQKKISIAKEYGYDVLKFRDENIVPKEVADKSIVHNSTTPKPIVKPK